MYSVNISYYLFLTWGKVWHAGYDQSHEIVCRTDRRGERGRDTRPWWIRAWGAGIGRGTIWPDGKNLCLFVVSIILILILEILFIQNIDIVFDFILYVITIIICKTYFKNLASRETRFPLVLVHFNSYVGELWTSLHCYHKMVTM